MWPTFDLRRPFTLALLALSGLAWLTLVVWGQSPYGRYLSHHSLDDVRGGGSLMLVFVAGWLVMLLAMMLPTSFGMLVYLGDTALHAAVAQSVWLADHAWTFTAAALLLAGLYQFTPLKYHCLDKCRSPFSFITEHWRGRGERGQAFLLGIHHGRFCIGCCWSLMLLMFAVGVGNFGWMLVLGALMAIEKNLPWGRRISAPLGVVLVGCGVGLLAVGL